MRPRSLTLFAVCAAFAVAGCSGSGSTETSNPESKSGGSAATTRKFRIAVIPKGTTVRIIGTALGNSMHGWTVPGFGIKKTVIPGRINEGWINVPKEGIYFGQCSQICGNGHSYMPIAVRVVSKPEFDKWVEQKKKAAGLAPDRAPATDFASATVPANR